MARVSVKQAARIALAQDTKARAELAKGSPAIAGVTMDSFVNFAQKMGVKADSQLSTASYTFNPITRNRTLLEWMHRGSWLAGKAIDVPADDMTRNGVEFVTELPPEHAERLELLVTGQEFWTQVGDVIRWGRLYGGAIGVLLVDGQDCRHPLRPNAIGPGQFKGMLVLDRWMLEPTLDDLVTDLGPFLGQPRYYRVGPNAPALRGQSIHYTRVAFRHVGIPLPYQQSLAENMWGISVLERLNDRMLGYDSATTGATQLVYKAFLRTMSVDNMRDIVASGGKPLEGLIKYMEMVRRFQNNEGITLIDTKDTFEATQLSAMTGIADVVEMLGSQLSGALEIPLVRLLGEAPGGLNADGDSNLRTYYDFIGQQQQRHLHRGVTLYYLLTAISAGIPIPSNFALKFRGLWELSEAEKATTGASITSAIVQAHEAGLLSDEAAMRELRQAARATGMYSNITQKLLSQAETQLNPPPTAQELLAGLSDPMGMHTQEDPNGNIPNGQDGQASPVPGRPRQRVVVPRPTDAGGEAGEGTPPGADRGRTGQP